MTITLKIDDGTQHEPNTVYLRLVESEPNHIVLEAVYDYGNDPDGSLYLPGGALLTVTAEGKIALSPNIDPDLGFPLDADGRLRLDAYCEAQTARRNRKLREVTA